MEQRKPIDDSKTLLTTEQAAARLNISPGTLTVWRATKRHILPYIKISKRFVRYRAEDIDAFIEAHAEQA